jgi:hypothetical protein
MAIQVLLLALMPVLFFIVCSELEPTAAPPSTYIQAHFRQYKRAGRALLKQQSVRQP